VSYSAKTLCIASQRVFNGGVYFVDSVRPETFGYTLVSGTLDLMLQTENFMVFISFQTDV
jgi:hypothetical protein